MNKINPISHSCSPHSMDIQFCNPFEDSTIDELLEVIDLGFGYYKYPEITLTLNSPGGYIVAMKRLTAVCQKYRQGEQVLRVHANRQCASAAALVLAQSAWGSRTVSADTQLLFHLSRTMVPIGQTLDREGAQDLLSQLSGVDDTLFRQLMASQCSQAGGIDRLLSTMQDRCAEVVNHWQELSQLLFDFVPTKAQKPTGLVQKLQRQLPQWLRLSNAEQKQKKLLAVYKQRFEPDTSMDLREAYALCLIDRVLGVLPQGE